MIRFFQRHTFAFVPFLLGLFFFAGSINVKAQNSFTIYGVTTTNQLVRFSSTNPGTVTTVGAITGLQTGENILGIDFRPANGQLYALGSTGRLYTINLVTGAATQVGTAVTTLNGTDFGFDFNPTVDRIRVVSDTGQNLRLNPNDGTVAATDPNLNPGTPSVTAAGYTNNFAGSTTTTLFDIDTGSDTLLQQNPANAGTLVAVGALGVDASGVNGFDIASRGNGAAVNTAFAALNVSGSSGLYSINLQTGAATLIAAFPNGIALRGLAIAFGTGTSGATNVLDFDGDRRADFAVFRLSNANVFISRPDGSFFGFPFGIVGDDIFAPGDYDGDGRTDIAVFRNSTGTFFVRNSATGVTTGFQFGQRGDEPVARDYDGDGKTDFAVARRANGVLTFFIRNSLDGSFRTEQFGFDTDIVAPGDYDGDGKFDIAVFRGSGPDRNGPAMFFVSFSSGGFRAVQFGLGSDLVVPGDYDGDGKTDFAVVRPGSTLDFFVLRSSDNSVFGVQFGQKGDIPVQNDYDGDGSTDIAVFRPTNGVFYIFRSSDRGVTSRQFGQNGDIPIASYDTH